MDLEKVIILDYGNQDNQYIARRIRELGVYSELLSNDINATDIKNMGNVKGIILSDCSSYIGDKITYQIDLDIFKLGIPILGVGYGRNLIINNLGVEILEDNILLTDISKDFNIVGNDKRKIYGIQSHLIQTEYETKILSNFIYKVCKAKKSWSINKFINQEIARIKKIVGTKKVLLGLSGGVDSSVVAVLIHKAIGNNLVCIFVDHGLLRKDEAKQVMD